MDAGTIVLPLNLVLKEMRLVRGICLGSPVEPPDYLEDSPTMYGIADAVSH